MKFIHGNSFTILRVFISHVQTFHCYLPDLIAAWNRNVSTVGKTTKPDFTCVHSYLKPGPNGGGKNGGKNGGKKGGKNGGKKGGKKGGKNGGKNGGK